MSNHMTGNSKHRLLKKQIFTLSAAFVFVISALTGSSYYANKRESEILAKNRTEMLASLSDGLGSSAASDTGTDSAASDEYINKVQTISANKGVVVFATSEPKKVKKLADDETTVTYGSLTLADFKTEKKAEKVIDSMKDSNVLMALGTTEFYIQGDPEETPAVDETVKGNGNSPLVALIDTGDNNADSSVNLTKDSDSDVNGHGTSMDAIIRKAANGNVRILSIKAMNDDGTGTLTNIAAAIRYAVDNGADIINMSIAAKADDNSRRVMQALVDEAAAKNIKVVAAAGNYGDSTSNYIPAGLSGVISVSAADNRGYLQKDVNSSAKIYIKEKTSTSSAAAEFTGYLANSESVKLSDHYDVLIDVKDNQHKSSSASDNSADSTFRTQETGWSLYMYWHDYHVENKNTGVPDEQKGLDPAHGDNPAKVVWNGFEINERTGGAKNDFNGWDNIHANKNGYNFNGFSDSPLYTTGRHKIYNARYNPHYGSSGYKSNGIHDAGSFYIHANSNSNAMSSGDWTWSGTKDLYPIWDAHEYRIRYNANGGSGYTPSMSVFYDYHGYVSSNNFSRPGYKFIGWNTRSDGNGRSWSEGQYIKGSFLYNALGDDDRYAPGYAGTYDLYAQWEPITRVDTSVNLHTGSTQNETMSDGTNSNDNDETMITFDVWKKATGSTTWSKIKSDVSSYGDSQKTGDVLIFSNIQVKPGYMWRNGVPGTLYNTTSIPTQYTASGEFPPTGENSDTGWIQANVTDKVEYKLVFDLQPAAYTVKFDKNSVKGQNGVPDYPEIELATGSMQDEAMQYGVSKALTKNAYTWRGHTFAGWNTQPDGSGTSYKDQQSGCLDMTKEDGSTVTLYAQWKPDSATVYLDPNGGTYTGDDGKEYTKKGEYSKTGTWGTPLELNDVKSATSDGTIKYDFNAKDASWADNQYSKVSASAINSNTDTTTFKLGGWKVYVDSDETIEQTAGTGRSGFVVDSTANPGLFTYIYGDTNGYLKAQYYGTAVYLPLPKREGYTFVGWYYDDHCLKKAGNAAVDDSSQPFHLDSETPNVTLYARWKENEPYTFESDMEFDMYDDDNPDFTPYIKIRKTDTAGNVMTTVNGDEFIFGICEGKTWSASSQVLTLKTGSGIYDKNNNQVMAFDSPKHDQTYGWWDITDLDAIKIGHDYTIHEISAPAGYSLCADQTFNVITNTEGYKADVKAKEDALDKLNNATSSQREAAKEAYKAAAEKVAKDETMVYAITGEDSFIYNPNTPPFKKTEDGAALANVEFTLSDKTDSSHPKYTFKTDKYGEFPDEFYQHLYAGDTMELKETSFEGYNAINVTFAVPRDGDISKVIPEDLIDTAHTITLKVKKTGADGKALSGAEFKLYGMDEKGNYIECRKDSKGMFLLPDSDDYSSGTPYVATSDASGIANFGSVNTRGFSLGPDSTADITALYVVETKAPKGYDLLSAPVKIELPDKDGAIAVYTISDNASATLTTLQAGGRGKYGFIAAGIALIAVAGIYLAMKKHGAKV